MYILDGDDESELVKYNWKKMGGEIYAHIQYIYNNPREREKSMERENSSQNLITKYPASKTRKRDAAKTTKSK